LSDPLYIVFMIINWSRSILIIIYRKIFNHI